MKKKITTLTGAMLVIALPALAHVSVSPVHVDKEAQVAAVFSVGHGCGEAATTAIEVTVPDGATAVQATRVEGWTLKTTNRRGQVGQVTWSGGNLASKAKGEFRLSFKAPNAGMMLYFPVTQSCGRTVVKWDEIPPPGGSGEGLTHPAPTIHIGPMTPGHDMSTMDHAH